MFLSYNANNGLPFVPTYNIKVVLPETSGLQPTNQVRIAGTRVGVVSSLIPHQDPATGRITAIADLKLEKSVEPLPANTTAIVLSVSAIGLKYLELRKGHISANAEAGSDDPGLAGARTGRHQPAVQHVRPENEDGHPDKPNQLRRWSRRTRAGAERHDRDAAPTGHQRDPGAAQPRRAEDGSARAVGRARPGCLARPLPWPRPMRSSSRPRHVLHGLGGRRSLARTNDRRWPGGARAGDPLVRRTRRRSLEKGAEFFRLLRPSAQALTISAAPLGHAFAVGAVNLRAATALNSELASAAQAIQAFAQNPVVTLGLEDLTQTTRSATRCSRGSRRAGQLQLPDADIPQCREPVLREHRRRHAGPRDARAFSGWGQRRGLPRLGARQRALGRPSDRVLANRRPGKRSTTTTCTTTPTRTSPGPASRGCVKRATRPTRKARQ